MNTLVSFKIPDFHLGHIGERPNISRANITAHELQLMHIFRDHDTQRVMLS